MLWVPMTAPGPEPTAARERQALTRLERVALIANPVAGRGYAEERARALERALAARGIRVSAARTCGPGDGRRLAAELARGTDLVCVIGGDGTLAEVVAGLPWPPPPVGVVPLGTANILALDLGLPRDLEGWLAALDRGCLRPLDVADVAGRVALSVVGAGLDAQVVHDLDLRREGPITKAAYLPAIARVLQRYRSPRLTVEVDGVPCGEVGLVLVANSSRYGGFLRLSPERVLDDGRYEVYLFRRASVPALAAAVARGILHHLPGGNVELLRARRVRVQAAVPVPIQVDGDPAGSTPFELVVRDQPLPILVP